MFDLIRNCYVSAAVFLESGVYYIKLQGGRDQCSNGVLILLFCGCSNRIRCLTSWADQRGGAGEKAHSLDFQPDYTNKVISESFRRISLLNILEFFFANLRRKTGHQGP